MLNITLLTVGRIKEEHFRRACEEYGKMLSGFCRFSQEFVQAEKLSGDPSDKEIQIALNKEGESILGKIPQNAYTVAMCIEGREMTSPQLASELERISLRGSNVCFIIGSSFGLGERVKERADLRLSMSKMTFPHNLARVMLMEQVYRALSISGNRKYHK
ncbi:MAG TPA: 23S rRNA (pseudouridine(1915)-N(3))-methyltransferase RlmH [Ruminococcaceae bacterium]|nr:23S rRNA (pseudouridine(1915)-N(3))-methyltransferase RlmH [Oscillospiraceae bacterium]